MKIAFFDCFAGVSGDMLLGALVHAGVDLQTIINELEKLHISGFSLNQEKVMKKGISGIKIHVDIEEQKSHRHLKDIKQIIEASSLSYTIKEKSLRVFQNLAEAEAKVHSTTPEKIHFHEVGALDAIVDIVGTVIGLELLVVDKIIASPINTGEGFVECEHGTIPIPAPATAELLQGIPVKSNGIQAELATPTGAAILKTLADGFGSLPEMHISSTGYGAGSRDLEIPNLLRLFIGEAEKTDLLSDTVRLIETNIDDMNPEFYDYLMERLFDAGALDIWLTSVLMKKTRPGILLSVLCEPEKAMDISGIILSETTTLGVRYRDLQRTKLQRKSVMVQTSFGEVQVKVAMLNGSMRTVSPEYEECKKIAKDNNIPLQQVYDDVKRQAEEKLLSIRESE